YHDNDPRPLLRRARLVPLALAAVLVGLVGVWAGDAFGPVAGALAACVAALDPNLLAQATQATTDLGFGCFFVAALLGVRAALRPAGAWVVPAAGLAIAATFATKHTAVLLVPAVLVLAAARLADARPWTVAASPRPLTTLRGRGAAVLALGTLWVLL